MEYYIHGETRSSEISRLDYMAAFAANFILRDLKLFPGQRVLDLACGVGAMTGQLARRFPGIHLFGVDIQFGQLRAAQLNHPIALYVYADAVHLPFRDQIFDCVHCTWVLEHVASPLKILKEARRVLKAGGTCQFTEVDNASFRTTPEYSEVMAVIGGFSQLQTQSLGDPYIGQRLDYLFREAGFSSVEARPEHLRGDASNPFILRSLSTIFADICESVELVLGPQMADTIHIAIARLRALPSAEGGAIYYSPVIVRATR